MRATVAVVLAALLVFAGAVGAAAVGARPAPAMDVDAAPGPATGPPASLGVQDGTNASGSANASNASGNASLGASVSSFMQASAADANSEVDAGVFQARFERADNASREALVQRRVGELERDLAQLREERRELLNASDVSVRERARAARLAVRARGLERAIDDTGMAAERANVKTTKLDALRKDARNMTGQEVAAIATGLADVDERGQRGPPGEVGPDRNGDGRPTDADRDRGNATDANGNATDANGNASGNAGDGRSDNAGDRGDGQGGGQENAAEAGSSSGKSDDGDGSSSG